MIYIYIYSVLGTLGLSILRTLPHILYYYTIDPWSRPNVLKSAIVCTGCMGYDGPIEVKESPEAVTTGLPRFVPPPARCGLLDVISELLLLLLLLPRPLARSDSKWQSAVGTAGPQRQVPDRSGHYRTSTTNTQSQTQPQTRNHKDSQPQTHNHKHAITNTQPKTHSHKRATTTHTTKTHHENTTTKTQPQRQTQTHSHKHSHKHTTTRNTQSQVNSHKHSHKNIFTFVWYFAWQVVTG